MDHPSDEAGAHPAATGVKTPLSGEAAAAFAAHCAAGRSPVEAALRCHFRLLNDPGDCVHGEPGSHGKEHDVWVQQAPDGLRAFKITRLPSRPYGLSQSPADYLYRWSRTNEIFADDVRVEGILPNGRFVISQAFTEGEHPLRTTLHHWLQAIGWEMYRGTDNIWHSRDGRIFLSEAHIGNFIQHPSGSIHPIDVALHSREEWLAQIEPDDFAEAYGTDHRPVSLEDLLEEAGGDLTVFGFQILGQCE